MNTGFGATLFISKQALHMLELTGKLLKVPRLLWQRLSLCTINATKFASYLRLAR